MSQQTLDLKASARILRRHRVIVAVAAALGLLAGAGYTLLYPPMAASEALVVLPASVHNTATHVVIAGSDPVLSRALGVGDGIASREKLHHLIQVKSLTSNVLSVTALGDSAGQAEATANAVASSYVAYISSASSPVTPVRAHILQRATTATATSLPVRLLELGTVGALAGALTGAVIALAIGRNDRRLRRRDEMAESAGAPVVASVRSVQPARTADWMKLLTEYEPGNTDAWRLRRALQYLHLGSGAANGDGSGSSLTVLSLSHDVKALALGPQLAVFAASQGIPTVLAVGPQQDAAATAALRAACAAPKTPSRYQGDALVTVSGLENGSGELPQAALTIEVAVVDARAPEFTGTLRTARTLLAVSPGTATAEQLARVAASAASAGRPVTGLLVADPDPADDTTGSFPQPARPAPLTLPAHVTGTATKSMP